MPATAKLVRSYLEETNRLATDRTPLLLNYRGKQMNRSGVRFVIDKHRRCAAVQMPTLRTRPVGPHLFRHGKAMHLLQAGVAPVTIKDILGHAHLKTLEVHVQADLDMKRHALKSIKSPIDAGPPIHRSEPDSLHWLEQL